MVERMSDERLAHLRANNPFGTFGAVIHEIIAEIDALRADLAESERRLATAREDALEEAAKVADAEQRLRESNAVAADHGSTEWGEPRPRRPPTGDKARMTTLEEMVETYWNAFHVASGDDVEQVRAGLLAVIEKHVGPMALHW